MNRVSTLETAIEMSEYVCNENNLDPEHLNFAPTNNSAGPSTRTGVNSPTAKRAPGAPTGPTPRTPGGRVNFSGVWALAGNSNLPSDPSYQPAALKIYQDRKSNPKLDPERYCLPDGVARVNALPYKLVQTPTLLVALPEGNTRAFRRIFLDGRDHSKQLDPGDSWTGDPIGSWDGDTLVVDIAGVNDKSWLDATGKPHSERLHAIERYRRPDFGHMRVDYALDDPKAFTKPYSFSRTFTLAEGWELEEYICQEQLTGPYPSHRSQAPAQ
jgi:hypothetical protein